MKAAEGDRERNGDGAAAPRLRRAVIRDDGAADPLDAIALAPGEPAFWWRSAARDVEIAALGAVACVDVDGPERFRDATAALAALAAHVEHAGPVGDAGDAVSGLADGLPLAVGGFAFDDAPPCAPWQGFPALRFFVPRVAWVRRGRERCMVLYSPVGREQTPLALLGADAEAVHPEPAADDTAGWRRRVEAAVEAIRGGRLRKIVLARRRSVRADAAPPLPALLRSLADARPGCFTFALRWSGRTFVGSSPERLVRLEGGVVEADALAGTAPRGHTPAHDEALARDLVASAKEAHEHRIVADAIRDALAPLAREVSSPPAPSVLTLPEAHHLHTPLRATLAQPAGLLDVAGRLHPTPAVCGEPRAVASRQLAGEEGDRGWYGGAVGWLDAAGQGELAVALRAALLGDAWAHVWAGAGIVEGSSPEREFDETERKMSSILPYFERGDECAA